MSNTVWFCEGDIVKCVNISEGDTVYGIHIGDGRIVMKQAYNGRGRILCIRKKVFEGNLKAEVDNLMTQGYRSPHDETTIMERAVKSMLEETVPFNRTDNNSMHFAIWCRYGPALTNTGACS